MLSDIKVLSYCIHFERVRIEKAPPPEGAYQKALSHIYWSITYILMPFLGIMLGKYGMTDQFLRDIWPYDYGIDHRTNLLAPKAVMALTLVFIVRFLLRRSFLTEAVYDEITKYYFPENSNPKHFYNICFIGVFCLISMFFSVFNVWFGPMACVLFLSIQELWIRHRFGKYHKKR